MAVELTFTGNVLPRHRFRLLPDFSSLKKPTFMPTSLDELSLTFLSFFLNLDDLSVCFLSLNSPNPIVCDDDLSAGNGMTSPQLEQYFAFSVRAFVQSKTWRLIARL